jgi:hypothetical protein
MCAIIDNSARDEVFGLEPSQRAKEFLKWLHQGGTKLALGGRLTSELTGDDDHPGARSFRQWLRNARLFGLVFEPDGDVEGQTEILKNSVDQQGQRLCKSNDPHVLALARVSGARLLFANDGNLIEDFQKNSILRRPPGKVYPTTDYHRFLHDRNNRELCSGTRYT